MAALTETYVDPAIAGNSGTGTIGDPYGDLQYALNTMTRDSTNGDRINIKAGTDEVLSSAISLATYGTPALGAPLVFQGYTSAAGDGGVGGVSGGGSVAVYSAGASYVSWRDLHLHNCGSASIVTLGALGTSIVACEVNNTSGSGIILASNALGGIVAFNHVHDIGTIGIDGGSAVSTNLHVIGNYLTNGAKTFTIAIRVSRGLVVERNIVSISGASDGISSATYFGMIHNNSILSSGGTGQGIFFNATLGVGGTVLGNLVEGFSGTGGIGIQASTANSDFLIYGQNAVYNCATGYSIDGDVVINTGDNESLGASPFEKSGSDTFANRAVYFAPVDTGNVHGGAYPTDLRLDKGAVQHADPSGGGGGGRRPRLVTVS